MWIFLRPHPDKTRIEDQPYVFEIEDHDWRALAEIIEQAAPDLVPVAVIVPFDAVLMDFPSEHEEPPT